MDFLINVCGPNVCGSSNLVLMVLIVKSMYASLHKEVETLGVNIVR